MISVDRRVHVELGLLGLAFGAVLSGSGFTDYGELHRMFTFADLRLLLVFAGAVVLAGIGFRVHCRGARLPRRPLGAGTVPGAVLFGVGWALCGGCPGAVLAMIGEGRTAALLTLVGILAGMALGSRVKGRLGWDSGTCGA